MTTGMKNNSSPSPDASRVTPTKDEPLVDARAIRKGRPFLSRKARRARRENGEKRSAKRPRNNLSPVTLVTVPQEFSISRSCETSCVNGRVHATARRWSPPHSPGDHEHAWARSHVTEPRPRRKNEVGAQRVRCVPSCGGRDGQAPRRHLWGFGSIRSWLSACRRRVVVLVVQFPPIGDGGARCEAVWCPECRPSR